MSTTAPATRSDRFFGRMAHRPGIIIGVALLITALLAVPFLTMAPDTTASQEPGGPVFEARDLAEDRFVSAVYPIPVVIESPDGDLATRSGLIALRDREAALRSDPQISPTLLSYFDPGTASDVVGVRTLADFVDAALPQGLDAATDAEVDAAVATIVDEFGPASDALGLSVLSTYDEAAGRWVVPAVFTQVLADNDQLGFSTGGVTLGTDTEREEYAREVVALLDAEAHEALGVAIDVNLTSQEQGAAAGPFIGFTILVVLLIVGLTFRSYWVLAVTGVALGALIIWLYGIANLVGLEDDLILSLVVPIAMISFGVDFTFHAVGRYREERDLGYPPRRAFTVGMSAVIGALVLALASDTAAFMANASSGIESIIQFGVSASIALVAAFFLLGIVTPAAVMMIDRRIGTPPTSPLRTVGKVGAALGAGLLAMTTVLLMVYIYPPAGVVALAVSILATLVVPVLVSRPRVASTTPIGDRGVGPFAARLGGAVAAIASRRRYVIPAALGLTVVAGLFAVRVPTEFDVKDFFAADSAFVVGLDATDEHVGPRGGEPAIVYVEADLTDPAVVARLATFDADLRQLEGTSLARDQNGDTRVEGSVLDVVADTWASPATLAGVDDGTGIALTDIDNDGVPDGRSQLAALYAYTRQAGIAFDETRHLLTPNDVRQRIWIGESGASATTFELALANTRRQEAVVEARDTIEPLVTELRTDLAATGAATVQLTGGPIVRQESLNAVSRALQTSLPIAVVLCFLIAAAFMRSVRFAAVSVMPILMTVALLYAFMETTGYAINLVTATIGAVSVGIGIDFAVHYTMRYREELTATGDTNEAVRRAGSGTGVALLASALSSAAGFFVLAFAPMPLFASYGLLTAVMILMAAASTLLVLPSLLVAVTPKRVRATVASTEPVPVPA